MATERVYSPDTSEPFDVTPSRARDLVLNEGWTRTAWTRAETVPAPVVEDDAPRGGRGRRRRAVEVPVEAEVEEDEVAADEPTEDEDAPSWRR